MQGKADGEWKASVTVEAVFVIPIVLFVIFALIYLTFYLHDRVRTEVVVEMAMGEWDLISAKRVIREEKEDISVYISGYIEEKLENGLFFLEPQRIVCEANGFSVKIKVDMKGTLSVWGKAMEFTLERKRPLHNPEEIMRVLEGMQIIMENIQQFQFVQNKIVKNEEALRK